jgi:Tfp pilus assembly protein PilV
MEDVVGGDVKLRTKQVSRKRAQAGISLLEVMIAGVVLIVGTMVGVLPMITYGIVTMRATDEETIAKQKARQIMESIYGARDTSQLGWDYINPVNVPTTNGTTTTYGVFLTGPQPMYSSGSDGVMGTADDAAAGIETITMPNGQTRTLTEFTRTITIGQYVMPDNSISPTLRTLKVEVTYPFGNGLTRTYTIQSLISQYK